MKSTLLFCLCLLVAVAPKVQAQPGSPQKTNAVHRLAQLVDSFDKIQYRHLFTYDRQGRPATHQLDYSKDGKLVSTGILNYAYDPATGKLLSKTSDKTKYLCFYNSQGALEKITQEVLFKDKWVLCEETLLQEKAHPSGNGKMVLFTLLKSTPLPGNSGKMSALELYLQKEYVLDKSNNIQRAKTLVTNYKTLEQPYWTEFYHDAKPNPFQNMFVERWYQFDLENGGLTNVNRKRVNGQIIEDRVYDYNELGYPVKCTINDKRTKVYSYELVEVPVTEKPAEVLAAEEKASAAVAGKTSGSIAKTEGPDKPFVLLYPNPATVNFTVKANQLGKGDAVLRVYDYFSMRVVYEVNYQVDGQMEALITTDAMPPSLYIVELTSPAGKNRQRLLVK